MIGEKEGVLCFLEEGEIKETSESYSAYMQEINRRLLKDSGGALIIDYGDDLEGDRIGDTLQALHHHKYAEVLKNPGEQDLTHHVSFASLKEYLNQESLKISVINQGEFLLSLGLEPWIEKLCRGTDAQTTMKMKTAAVRLIAPGEMGNLFKVLAVESR